MPTSKQARSAQNRQKDRLALAAIEKHKLRRRRRIIASVVAVVLVAGLVFAVIAVGSDSGKKVETAGTTPNANSNAATTTPPTTVALASVAGKPCVKMTGTLPKGAPAVPYFPGPPPNKLTTADLKVGTGAAVPAGATVTVNYVGVACTTGKIFDSSWSRGQTATFPLTGVIPGWTQGLPGMKVGGRRLLAIPPALGYGDQGSPPSIAPGESLFFVVDMVKINPPTTSTT